MLKIKQMYLGDNKYRFDLIDDIIPFEMEQNFQLNDLEIGKVVEFQKTLYKVEHAYDCPDSPEEDEVVIYVLTPIQATFKVKLKWLEENE